MAGLLHDFGLMLLDEYFSELFAPVIEMSTRQGTPFIQEEENLFGVTHADVAAALFAKWELPQTIRYAMRRHHLPDDKAETAGGAMSTVSSCVGLANQLAKVFAIGREVDQFITPVADAALANIKCLGLLNEQFFKQVFDQVNLFCRFLNLETRVFPEEVDPRDERRSMRVSFIDRNNFSFNPFEHYLRLQGIAVVKLASDAKTVAKDIPPNLIILHTKPDDSSSAIAELHQGLGKNAVSGASFSVPTLILHSPKSRVAALAISGKVKMQVDTVDLSNIDMAISQLLGFSDAGKKEAPAAEPKVPATAPPPEPKAPSSALPPVDQGGLSITLRELSGTLQIIDLAGSIRLTTLTKLKELFMEILQKGTKNVALNLSAVDFMDSSGTGLIVNFFKRLTGSGGKVCLVRLSAEVTRLLEDVNLNKVLPIVADESELPLFFG
jgi:anti-anti-sigma factor